MTINITSGSSGWGNYVLYGTKDKPRESDKVEFLEGDIALGDRLSQSNNYEESYYKIVLAFEGKPDDEVIKSAYEDFKKEMFIGFKRDEYHIDAVVHKDTDNYHIHCRIPKQNLKTDTHLQLYMDKIDRPRKELIQDHISLKYGFNIARETNREVFKEQAHEQINKWREQHNQKPFDFSNKKGQAEAEAQINGYLSELIKSGLIEKREDISTTLQELGLKIEKENGLDIKKDFAYTTVSNDSGKMRIKGEIHHDRFYINNQKDRTASIENNRRIEQEREPNQERAERVRRELSKANEKRFRKVAKLFSHARKTNRREHKQTLETGRVESINSIKSIKSNSRIIDRNTDTKTTNEIGAVHREQKLHSNRRAELYKVQPKRAVIRPNETNLLLQNKLKERANERLINETIRRIREQREVSETALQRARNEREALQRGIERDNKELQNRTSKIANYYDQIRRKVIEKIEQTKQSFTEKLEKIKDKYIPKKEVPEVQKEEAPLLEKDERLEKLIEQMEARTGNQEARASNILNKSKELTSREKFEQSREVTREKMKENNEISINEVKEPTKKRSFQKQR